MKKNIIIGIILNLLVLCLAGIKIRSDVQEDVLIENIFITDEERYKEPLGEIKGGVYTVTLEYQASDNYKIHCGGTGNFYPGIYAEEHWLKAAETVKEFRFWANGKIDSFYILMEHDGANGRTEGFFLDVENIRISRNFRATLLYNLLRIMVFLSVIDAGVLIYWKREQLRRDAYVILGLSLIFLVSSLGVFAPGQILGHDLYFHLARIKGMAEAVMTGEFPVKMQPEWFNGYGHPVSVFYGDILLYIPAILYMLSVPLEICYRFFVLLINLGTTLISYFCFKHISRDKYAGVACTAVYMLSTVRIINVYLRAAVGEYSAAMFLPLIAVAIWKILMEDTGSKNYQKNCVILSLGMTGIIQTHMISLEMTGIFLIIVCLCNIKRIFRKETFATLFKSVIMTLLINMGFFIPFLDYSRENLQIFSERDFYGIQGFGLSLYELFSVNTVGVGKANIPVMGLKDRIPVSLGFTGLLVLALALCRMLKSEPGGDRRRCGLAQTLGFTGIALGLATCYFPWNYLADMKLFRNVVFSIEFPWRFLTIAMVFVSMAAGLALSDSKRGKVVLLIICVVSACQGLQCMDMTGRNTEIARVFDGDEVMNAGTTLEYVYEGTDLEALMIDNRVHGENVDIMEFDRNGNNLKVVYQSGEDAFLEFPVFAYPYYQCEDIDTGKKFDIEKGEVNNRIRIRVADNYNGGVRVSYVQPWHWRTAEIISIISFIAVAGYGLFKKRTPISGQGE